MDRDDRADKIEIRRATESDWGGIWPIFQDVVAGGDSFAYSPDTTEPEARGLYFAPGNQVYVAVDGDMIVGSYLNRANQRGLGNHIANGAYMTHPDYTGRGVGRLMGEHSLNEAKAAGFLAMQFNYVVSTNEPAVRLWKSLGFRIIGTIPRGFRHSRLGFVDALIMFRELD